MNYQEVEINGQVNIIIELADGGFKSFPADLANPEYAAFLESLNDDTETE